MAKRDWKLRRPSQIGTVLMAGLMTVVSGCQVLPSRNTRSSNVHIVDTLRDGRLYGSGLIMIGDAPYCRDNSNWIKAHNFLLDFSNWSVDFEKQIEEEKAAPGKSGPIDFDINVFDATWRAANGPLTNCAPAMEGARAMLAELPKSVPARDILLEALRLRSKILRDMAWAIAESPAHWEKNPGLIAQAAVSQIWVDEAVHQYRSDVVINTVVDERLIEFYSPIGLGNNQMLAAAQTAKSAATAPGITLTPTARQKLEAYLRTPGKKNVNTQSLGLALAIADMKGSMPAVRQNYLEALDNLRTAMNNGIFTNTEQMTTRHRTYPPDGAGNIDVNTAAQEWLDAAEKAGWRPPGGPGLAH